MLNSLNFAKRFVLSRLVTPLATDEAADQVTILCPPEEYDTHSAIALPEQLDKVKEVPVGTTFAHEILRINGGTRKHNATKALHFHDAWLIGGSVYSGSYRYRITHPTKNNLTGQVHELETTALVNSYVGMAYFGHWLRDDMLTYELTREIATPLKLSLPDILPETLNSYAELFEQDWQPSGVVHARELIIYADYAQNGLKQERYRLLRAKFRQAHPSKETGKRVFLRRGLTGVKRIFENEDQIIEHLAARGFSIVDVENDSIDEILNGLSGAQLVVSIEGSHISHCVYSLADDGVLVTIQPPFRFNNVHKDWLDAIGCRYAYVVCDPSEGGFRLNPDELDATLDLVDRHVT